MKKGQGAMEYLIIIAAVLAIAAIAVLFITSVFPGTSPIASCKEAASRCANEKATSSGAECPYCITACAASDGSDAMASTITVDATTCPVDGSGTATACCHCRNGSATNIYTVE